MPTLIPIVEGDGEVAALPLLLRRLFQEVYQVYDVRIARPKNAHGCGNLTAPDQLERFVAYALLEPECDGVLVLIDNDAVQGLIEGNVLDEDCAPAFAQYLAARIQAMHPSKTGGNRRRALGIRSMVSGQPGDGRNDRRRARRVAI